MNLRETPLETYEVKGVPVHVKREDLCWPFPPLSKARGVWAAIERRPGMSVAVVDTGRSLNGQLAATIGLTLGRKVKCGYPVYAKDIPGTLPGPALAIRSLGVELVPLRANRQFMMRAEMQRKLCEEEDGSTLSNSWYLLPTGLRLPETVDAVEFEAVKLWEQLTPRTLIIPTGTGTHLAGLLRSLQSEAERRCQVVAVQGYARPEERFRVDVERMSGIKVNHSKLRVISSLCDYYEVRPDRLPPFPANMHYEVRAWKWLHTEGVIETLEQPIIFWNIGA